MERFGDILSSASNGDDGAWAAILERYQTMMRLALDRAGMSPELRQRLDPEDVMQAALLRAHRELPRNGSLDQESFATWLLQVTLHTLEDRVRHHHRERRSLRGEEGDAGRLTPADPGEGPLAAAARVESRLRLMRSISTLDCEDQRILLWRFVEGRSVRQIAEALGVSEGRARDRLAVLLHQMRKDLGEV